MEKRVIVEAKLLVSLKTRKGEILRPRNYYPPLPLDLVSEIGLNRGTVIVKYQEEIPEITVPPEPVIEQVVVEPEKIESEKPKETKPASVVRRRKK